MIAAMKRLTLAAPKSDVDRLCKELVWLESVEVASFDPADLPEDARGFDNAGEMREAERELQRITAAIDELASYGAGGKKQRIFPEALTRRQFESLDENGERAAALLLRFESTRDKKAALHAEASKVKNEMASLAPFLDFDEPIGLNRIGSVALLKGTFPKLTKLDAVREGAEAAGFDFELCELGESGDYRYVYALVPERDADEFARFINAEGFSRIVLDSFGTEDTAKQATERRLQKLSELEREEAQLTEEFRTLARDRRLLEERHDLLSAKLETERVKQKLLATECACILTGWVPEARIPALEKELEAFECCYTLEEPGETEKVPVRLVNNRFSAPFESVLGLYSYPDYHGIDPTFVMSIFYFIIFGLIMQDVLYGALLLFGCMALKKALHSKPGTTMYKMLSMFSICGVSTMICGVLFGGYFGDLPAAIATKMFGMTDFPDLAIAFNPVVNPMPYLVLSLAMGVLHLVAGMLMNAYMLIRKGKAIDAVCDVGMWLVLFAGIGLLFVAPTVGKWVAIAGVAGLVLTQGRAEKNIVMKLAKGVMSLYGIVNYISDLLSYSRIMALGLSGAIIAQVVNIIGTLGGPTVVGFLVLILALVLGHGLNLALNVLGAFVHTARLQYIEFLGKFYIDGGEEFKPASVKTKYTEIIKEAK